MDSQPLESSAQHQNKTRKKNSHSDQIIVEKEPTLFKSVPPDSLWEFDCALSLQHAGKEQYPRRGN